MEGQLEMRRLILAAPRQGKSQQARFHLALFNHRLQTNVHCRKAERDDIVFRIAEPKVHAWLLTAHSDSREWQENIALFLGLRSDLGGEACCAQPSESMLGRTRAVAPTCAGSLPTQSGCSTALCQCTRPVPSPVHMYHCR